MNAIHGEKSPQPTTSETSWAPHLDSNAEVLDRRLGLVGRAEGSRRVLPFADTYAAWDQKNLTLVMHVADHADRHFYSEMKIPLWDAMEWTITTPGGKKLRVRFGEGIPAHVEGGSALARVIQKSARFVVVLKLPASALGVREFHEGQSITPHSSLSGYD